jgi:hypothetical protein
MLDPACSRYGRCGISHALGLGGHFMIILVGLLAWCGLSIAFALVVGIALRRIQGGQDLSQLDQDQPVAPVATGGPNGPYAGLWTVRTDPLRGGGYGGYAAQASLCDRSPVARGRD